LIFRESCDIIIIASEIMDSDNLVRSTLACQFLLWRPAFLPTPPDKLRRTQYPVAPVLSQWPTESAPAAPPLLSDPWPLKPVPCAPKSFV